MWIKIEDELPIQDYAISIRNGKTIVRGVYYRKKWWSWGRRLHMVTEWYKCPVSYPSIPQKDMRAYLRRAERYRGQIKTKFVRFGPLTL